MFGFKGTPLKQELVERQSKLACLDAIGCSTPITAANHSLYLTESSSDSEDEKASKDAHDKLKALNTFMAICGKDEVRTMKVPWSDASSKTKGRYVSMASGAVNAVLNVIAPQDEDSLWNALQTSKMREVVSLDIGHSDSELMKGLIESYRYATHRDTRKQILSIMADKLTFKEIERLIPGITNFEFKQARKHQRQFGRGAVVQSDSKTRERTEPGQLDHFIDFITSSHVIQDLPFGERTLKLSSGEIIEIPNVVRMLAPSQLVEQYLSYCREVGFTPLGKSTLFRLLSKSCVAPVRKCLQGLDNYAAEGGKGFDDLCSILDKLTPGIEDKVVEELKHKLIEGKRYLKGDYKVCLRCMILQFLHEFAILHTYMNSLQVPIKMGFLLQV